jgi:hypothetical protein
VLRRQVLASSEDCTSGSVWQESTLTRIDSTIRMLAFFDRETVGSQKIEVSNDEWNAAGVHEDSPRTVNDFRQSAFDTLYYVGGRAHCATHYRDSKRRPSSSEKAELKVYAGWRRILA